MEGRGAFSVSFKQGEDRREGASEWIMDEDVGIPACAVSVKYKSSVLPDCIAYSSTGQEGPGFRP